LRSEYHPPDKTSLYGWQAPDGERERVRSITWSWRARVLPHGGNECVHGKEDSAASVYLTWRRGLRWYTLKYVWSASGAKGAVCHPKRNPFVAQDTVILETGPSGGAWRTETIDLAAAFRRHFEHGDPSAPVPPFYGIGLLTDGDQTGSPSSADFGTFTLAR
jgi:hypothetical protein